MLRLLRRVDTLLKARTRTPGDLESALPRRSGTLLLSGLLLGGFYGAFMGLYGATRPQDPEWLQLLATIAKVPLLFLCTLLVTFPSLYVFSTLAGGRLSVSFALRVLLAAIVVNLAVLASFGPIVGFFTLSTDSYPFMVLLNVLLFAVAGLIGLSFLRRFLDTLYEVVEPAPKPGEAPQTARLPDAAGSEASDADATEAPDAPESDEPSSSSPTGPPLPPPPPTPSEKDERPPVPRISRRRAEEDWSRSVFKTWLVIYAVVGAQMAWILRPFIGDPARPFQWMRERDSNFFGAVFDALRTLLDN